MMQDIQFLKTTDPSAIAAALRQLIESPSRFGYGFDEALVAGPPWPLDPAPLSVTELLDGFGWIWSDPLFGPDGPSQALRRGPIGCG